ncbi:MAG: deoxyribose-phosphate aldolase [Bdellovibrionaceae bacterium]|nr:deoxyribose-phosphate aldolase [Pseudobdellovibrionaceae bacterium]MDW8190915.1 deoxyribose-phosphate aldolase [Pseudobdellovibrionaceae bacterium]
MEAQIKRSLAPYIEHTLLKPEAKESDIVRICQEANHYQFVGVCVNSYWLPTLQKYLNNTILRISVIGFPLGASLTLAKVKEASLAVEAGAQEIDMVLNIGAFKSGYYKEAQEDIIAVKKMIGNVPLKVIVETSLLNPDEKKEVTQLVLDSGADFIKTSTGFSGGGASEEDILLFKNIVGSKPLKIKASGGIRSADQAWRLIKAGAHRLGTSQGCYLMQTDPPVQSNISY